MLVRMPHLAAVLLLAVTSLAGAQSSLPDPVAPAVVGRPLDQIRPVRPAHPRPAAPKPHAHKPVAPPSNVVQAEPPAPAPAAAPAPVAVAEPVAPRSKPLVLGTFFNRKDQAVLRNYYDAHPVAGGATHWRVGAPVPGDAVLRGVPDDVRSALPALRDGYQYVQVDDEVVLLAVPSRMVLDGVARNARLPAASTTVLQRIEQQVGRYFARD